MERGILKIPVNVFEQAETKGDLEDWLMAHNPVWIAEMKRRVRKMREGEVLTRENLRGRWSATS